MTTLRDALEGAFTAAEAGTLEAVNDPPALESTTADPPPDTETASETTARNRDDAGRFASKPKQEATDEVIVDPAAAVVEETKPSRKAPTSWKKDYWGQWERLGADPELAPLQDYIEQREGEFVKGVSAYRDEAIKARDLQEAITPFLPILQQHNLNPAHHIRALMSAHQTLVSAPPEQKLQMFQRLALDYGVPLQAITNQQYDPQSFQVLQELNSLRGQLGEFQQTAQQREQAEMQAHIEAFKANAPHFEAVRGDVIGLLESCRAPDLKTAYEKACWMNDAVRSRMQSEQTAAAQRAAAQTAAAKKAAAVSTRSSAPTGQKVAVSGDDLRSTLDAAFAAHAGGGRL